jgi:hypothetical protein
MKKISNKTDTDGIDVVDGTYGTCGIDDTDRKIA